MFCCRRVSYFSFTLEGIIYSLRIKAWFSRGLSNLRFSLKRVYLSLRSHMVSICGWLKWQTVGNLGLENQHKFVSLSSILYLTPCMVSYFEFFQSINFACAAKLFVQGGESLDSCLIKIQHHTMIRSSKLSCKHWPRPSQ